MEEIVLISNKQTKQYTTPQKNLFDISYYFKTC